MSLNIQKRVSHTGSHTHFLIYYELCLETAGYVFQIVFHGLFLSHYILMHSVMRTQFKDSATQK